LDDFEIPKLGKKYGGNHNHKQEKDHSGSDQFLFGLGKNVRFYQKTECNEVRCWNKDKTMLQRSGLNEKYGSQQQKHMKEKAV